MGLPGLTRLDHVGFTVPDLEAAHTWLVDVLGCEYMYSLGPFQAEDDWMQEHMNVDPRTVMRQLRFFRCGGQAVFEVFQYDAPDQRSTMPRNSALGGPPRGPRLGRLGRAVGLPPAPGVSVLGDPTT